LPGDNEIYDSAELKKYLTVYPENEMIRTLVKTFSQKNTGSVIKLD
jgi:hypothetical protein